MFQKKFGQKKAKYLIPQCKYRGCTQPGTERAVLKRNGEVIGLCPFHYDQITRQNLLSSRPNKVLTHTHVQPMFQRPPPKA
jgi:hypothetical protein